MVEQALSYDLSITAPRFTDALNKLHAICWYVRRQWFQSYVNCMCNDLA